MASPLGCKEAIALLFSTLENAGEVSSDEAANNDAAAEKSSQGGILVDPRAQSNS
ncbi:MULTISPECIES: hypothetical protein [Prochlorococcus]|uniref:hypothetical protein n=1 Tax=Prochlorococcus TaxID=1218 RepID=UPI0007BB9C95|nr:MULTISPECIES: hypothetical protein [Prochlorococcus]KZR62497.1 hypothetical protein PMIT1312_01963 [Prochlorococcus marinus str. MIT 1312]KZR81019.1 hypothetical protein PMIT1327_01467 [Prochlorococcus marinus str. MIT 1327]